MRDRRSARSLSAAFPLTVIDNYSEDYVKDLSVNGQGQTGCQAQITTYQLLPPIKATD